MIYYLYHWYKGDGKHHPDAFEFPFYTSTGVVEAWAVEVEDIHEWVMAYGKPIKLVPPSDHMPYWSIYISDGFRFSQR